MAPGGDLTLQWRFTREVSDVSQTPAEKEMAELLISALNLEGKSPGDIGPPFLYRFPLGLLILGGFAVVGGLGAVLKRRDGAAPDRTAPDRTAPERTEW